ncbi:MAG: hypothetical protein Q8P86_02895 [bacterium]|nr:hypothetical protein [bacterium]
MKINGKCDSGTTFTVEVAKEVEREITESENHSPNGLAVEAEMRELVSILISLLEVAFRRPEPE